MFVYVLFVPALVLLIIGTLQLRGLRRHDVVLYRFCEVRRELMIYLRKEGLHLSPGDYEFAALLADTLHSTIHNYQHTKKKVFNFRKFLVFFTRFKESVNALNRVPTTENKELLKVRNAFGNALVEGFMVFTPFFRHELALRAISYLAVVGGKRLTTRVRTFIALFRQQASEYGPKLAH
jgi:hypothetical protein